MAKHFQVDTGGTLTTGLVYAKKRCLICEKLFEKKIGVTKKQWNNSKYCSLRCFNSTKKGTKYSKEHKEFHKKYGTRNNSREQLNDFLNNG